MLRLAVFGADKLRWQALADRLRGVTLDESLPTCQACAFAGPPFDDAMRCLQAGKPVLIASAIGLTREFLRTSASHANLTIVNPDRYLPSRQLIRQQLDAGKLGAPGLIRMHRWESAATEASLLRDLDLALWYAGAMPNVVYAVGHARGTQVHLGFAGGGMALLEQAIIPADESYGSLAVIGANGAAYADDHQNMQLAFRGGAPRAIKSDEGVGQWVTLLQEYIDRVASATESESCPTWQQVVTVADAVENSLRTKETVALKGVP